jgi:hypothetical protein
MEDPTTPEDATRDQEIGPGQAFDPSKLLAVDTLVFPPSTSGAEATLE